MRLRLRARSTKSARLTADGGTAGRALSVPFALSMVIAFWLTFAGALPLLALVDLVAWSTAFADGGLNPVASLAAVVIVALAVPILGFVVDGLRGKAVRGALLPSPQGVMYRTWGHDALMSGTRCRP
jgi:hypothetical protein